jgi:hypothetical protein
MDHAVSRAAAIPAADRAALPGVRPNWRLMLAIGVNVGLWSAMIVGVRALID